MKRFIRGFAWFVLFAAACSPPASQSDAGEVDSGTNAPDMSTAADMATVPPDTSVTPTPDASASNDTGNVQRDAQSDGGPVDMRPPRTPVFVAQGHMGRTTVSCDDGASWVEDTSMDDSVRCFTDGFDCDHHPGAGRGVEWGDGQFLTTFGWGPPGGIDRSTDGISWERVLDETTFGGVVYGNGTWLAAGRRAQVSTDGGTTWVAVEDTAMTEWNVRRAAFVDADGGRFVMVADTELVVSPNGTDWTNPTIPEGCGSGVQTTGGIAYGNGSLTVVGRDGESCFSTDAGDTWSLVAIDGDVTSHLVWDGEQFVVWGRGVMHASTDGETWTTTPTTPDNLHLGPTAYNPETGTYVGVRGGWQNWYDDQAFYRSADGVTWEELPTDAFAGSHPIRDIGIGFVEPDVACPAQ